MKFLLTIFSVSLLFSALHCAVFLAGGGSKICTLNNVGSLPAANNPSVKYPVYQKVCRAVVPTALGDQIDDEEEEIPAASRQLRRAIIQSE